jgi:tetratricopeptide (TPR) repeat protein
MHGYRSPVYTRIHAMSMIRRAKSILIYLSFWMLPGRIYSHGDVHERIEQVSTQLASQPANPLLLIQRGRLHIVDGNPRAALPDLEKALSVDPGNQEAHVLLAGALLKTGEANKAVIVADHFLREHPGHPEVQLIRARSLSAGKRYSDAVSAFDAAFAVIPRPGPDLFIEQARASAQSKTHGYRAAIKNLEHGISVLGPLAALQVEAFKYEVAAHDVDAAAKRIDELIALGGRPEEWLVRRAEMYESEGKGPDAARDYQSAKQMMLSRPQRIKRTEAYRELLDRVEHGIKRAAAELNQ